MLEHICQKGSCQEIVPQRRWDLGYRTCLQCGSPKKEFTVGIPYNKGPYMVISNPDIKDMGKK